MCAVEFFVCVQSMQAVSGAHREWRCSRRVAEPSRASMHVRVLATLYWQMALRSRERERAGWIREALAAPPRSGIRRRLRFCKRPLGLRQSERWRRRFICWRRPHRVGAAAAAAAAGCSRFGGPGGGCAAYRIGSSNACHCAREPLGRRRRWRWKAPSAANGERQARTEPRMNPSLRLAQARRFCQLACRPLKRESSRMLQQRRRRWRWRRRLKQRELQPELSRTAMNATTSQTDRRAGSLSH